MTDVVPYVQPLPDHEFTAEWLRDPPEIANRIGGTHFVPTSLRNNPAAITAALLYGAEVGLGRMQSLARISMINGRPTLAAETMRALVLRAGHDIWVEELTVSRCVICGRRRGSDAISRVAWTMDDARRANLAGRQPWKMYPRQMLLARASAELARAVFPDAIARLAATEELEDNPEPATENGTEPAAPTTRRRRRANVTAQPPTPNPQPASTAAPDTNAAEGAGEAQTAPPATEPNPGPTLPPDEQEIVDQLEREFGARPTESEPQLESEPEQAPITDAQRRKIHALFREQNVSDRDERLHICGQIIGRDVPTSTSLTLDEASQIIDHLEHQDESSFQPPPGATGA